MRSSSLLHISHSSGAAEIQRLFKATCKILSKVEMLEERSAAAVKGLSMGPDSMPYGRFTMETTLSTCSCTLSETSAPSRHMPEILKCNGLSNVQVTGCQYDTTGRSLDRNPQVSAKLLPLMFPRNPLEMKVTTPWGATLTRYFNTASWLHHLRKLIVVGTGSRLLKRHSKTVFDDGMVRVGGTQHFWRVFPQLTSRRLENGHQHQSGGHVDHVVLSWLLCWPSLQSGPDGGASAEAAGTWTASRSSSRQVRGQEPHDRRQNKVVGQSCVKLSRLFIREFSERDIFSTDSLRTRFSFFSALRISSEFTVWPNFVLLLSCSDSSSVLGDDG